MASGNNCFVLILSPLLAAFAILVFLFKVHSQDPKLCNIDSKLRKACALIRYRHA